MKDFKVSFLLLAFGLPLFLILFIAVIYFSNCGFNNDCSKAALPPILHTPIPTLIPATLPVAEGQQAAATAKCTVTAKALLSAWVSAGYSETEPFTFQDTSSTPCAATFADVQPLFAEANLWYSGALACASCHNADVAAASAQMDLSSYAGILAGSRRTSADATGNDILGGGSWEASKLNEQLFVLKKMPFGRPEGAVPDDGPTVLAGHPASSVSTTETAPTSVSEAATPTATAEAVTPAATPEAASPAPTQEVQVPAPSNPGGPGEAASLKGDPASGAQVYSSHCAICHGDAGKGGIANSGSTDGTVPPLNPIDPGLVNADYATFAKNIDLFIEHGSAPEGPNPALSMPAWGEQNLLSQQEIADVIAYIISLNGVQAPAVSVPAGHTVAAEMRLPRSHFLGSKDISGAVCKTTFADAYPPFIEASLWQFGHPANAGMSLRYPGRFSVCSGSAGWQ